MIKITKHWTLEALRKEALMYETREEFRVKSLGAYMCAFRHKLLNKLCTHMSRITSL
jgi:hypothetical protein